MSIENKNQNLNSDNDLMILETLSKFEEFLVKGVNIDKENVEQVMAILYFAAEEDLSILDRCNAIMTPRYDFNFESRNQELIDLKEMRNKHNEKLLNSSEKLRRDKRNGKSKIRFDTAKNNGFNRRR